jgi:hypothetical protein
MSSAPVACAIEKEVRGGSAQQRRRNMEASSPAKWHEDAAPAKTAAGLGRRRGASSRGGSRGEVARGCLRRSARQSSLAGVVELGSGVGAARRGPANGRSGLRRTAQRRMELGNCALLKGEREGVEEGIRRRCRAALGQSSARALLRAAVAAAAQQCNRERLL